MCKLNFRAVFEITEILLISTLLTRLFEQRGFNRGYELRHVLEVRIMIDYFT